jgi:hypothetical protein
MNISLKQLFSEIQIVFCRSYTFFWKSLFCIGNVSSASLYFAIEMPMDEVSGVTGGFQKVNVSNVLFIRGLAGMIFLEIYLSHPIYKIRFYPPGF